MSNFMQETMFTDALCEAMTSKRSFLKTIDSLIPWEDWISKIQPVYYEGRIGQKPYPIELVLRMYVLQNLYDLSDMGVMTEVIDSRAFSWFCGITSPADVPDGDTVGRFRNLLIKNDIQKLIFENVTALFEGKGWILKKGTIVDSTIIAAPSSTKNKEHKRDPEAKSTKKGSNYHFGYKAHIGVDKDTGLIHHVKATEASVHDTNGVEDTIYGEEEEIYGDSGYLNVEEHISEEKSDDKRKYFINLRKSMIAKMEPNDQLVAKCENACYSSVRSKVEHPFNVVKRLFKFRRTRYRGLLKQQAKFYMIFALANLYLADRKKPSA